jgi:hypothetical protein
MPSKIQRRALVACLAAGCAATAGTAFAQTKPTCDSLVADNTLPHPVYGNGGSAITADLGKVAAALAGLSSPINILYSDSGGACTQLEAYVDQAVKTDFHYWTADGQQHDCTAPLAGQATSFAHNGNPASACTTVTLPGDVKDFGGPVQVLNLVTGPQSSEQVVSADSLYVTYGFATLAPWTNTAHIVKRSGTSFATLLLSAAIGVPGSAFLGDVTAPDQKTVIDTVVAAATSNAQDAIGYVSGSAAYKAAGTVKILAFQAKGQSCGFWPDSAPNKKDRLNVRTGQYELWTPGHFLTKVDGSGNPVDPDVKNLIDWYLGNTAGPDGVDVTGLITDSGDVPLCAMQVTREGLLGAISSWAPDANGTGPCTHYFEQRATGSTTGTPCTNDMQCTNAKEPKCRFTYCEAY